jgi:uncharacterized protein (DUF2236 family)
MRHERHDSADCAEPSPGVRSDRLGPSLGGVIALLRKKAVGSTVDLFSHGPDPLADTLSHGGDPGLFGPGSVTWPVLGDPASFVGGIRAMLLQAAHPEVAAGVSQHSRYRQDPLGRLSRTSAYVSATAYGALPEVHAAVRMVNARHRRVAGRSHRDRPYAAAAPELAAWVHNTLVDSFVTAQQRYGGFRLSTADADRFVEEQTAVGRLLGADPLPATAASLAAWIGDHPQLAPSPGQREAIAFLRRPPLPPAIRVAYGFLFRAAVATVPPRIRQTIGVRRAPGAVVLGRAATGALRWALGPSPAWQLATTRVGAPPPALGRRPSPAAGTVGA